MRIFDENRRFSALVVRNIEVNFIFFTRLRVSLMKIEDFLHSL